MYGFLIIMFLLMPLFMLVLLLALVSNFVMVSMVNEERHERRFARKTMQGEFVTKILKNSSGMDQCPVYPVSARLGRDISMGNIASSYFSLWVIFSLHTILYG